MQKEIAYNILDYRYTELAKPCVVVSASAAVPAVLNDWDDDPMAE